MSGLRWRGLFGRSQGSSKRGWGPASCLVLGKPGSTDADDHIGPVSTFPTHDEQLRLAEHGCTTHQGSRMARAFTASVCALTTALSFFTTASAQLVYDIDVACAYSPSAATRAGGEENLQVKVAAAIAGANLIHQNSRTGVRLRIAGFLKSTADPYDTDTATLLDLLSWYSGFADVRTFAANVGADLVTYISKNTGYAGAAELPGQYSAIADHAVWYTVLAHELAHNLGATHQDGLQFVGTNGTQYTTIMLMNYCAGTTIPYFTNPELTYMGVRLQGSTSSNCGMGALVNNGNNAGKIASSAPAAAATRTRPLPASPLANGLVYRWSFNCIQGAVAPGTIILDSVSAAPAIIRGNGAVFTGSGLRLPGTTTGNTPGQSMAAFVDLPNGIISAWTNLTIELWVKPLGAKPGQRAFSFGRTVEPGNALPGEWITTTDAAAPGSTTAHDEIALCLSTGYDPAQLRLEVTKDSAVQKRLDATISTTISQTYHYVLTYEAGKGAFATNGGRFTWYRNGEQVGFADVSFRLASVQDVNNWLGRAQSSTNSNACIELDEVRLYNRALTPNEVLASYLAGPDAIRPSAPYTAGELLVDLRAPDFNGTLWSNRTSLGNFTPTGKPTLVLNVSNTGVPGIYFNGSTDAFIGPNSTAAIEGDAARSIEVWVFNPALASEETMVSWGERKATRFNIAFNFGSSTTCGAATHSGDDIAWGGATPGAGAWQYLVYTHSNQVVSLYVNGTLRWQQKLNGPLTTTPAKPLNIGCQRNPNNSLSQFFSGFINSVRVHAGVLSPEQIAGNYLLGPARQEFTIAYMLNSTPEQAETMAGRPVLLQPTYNLPAWATNQLAYGLLNAPQGAYIDPGTGKLYWRPTMAQAGRAYTFAVYAVATNSPGLAATQWLTISVTAPPPPVIASMTISNNMATLLITGEPGPDYHIQASTNLTNWDELLVTNPVATPFTVQDPNMHKFTRRFYRVALGP